MPNKEPAPQAEQLKLSAQPSTGCICDLLGEKAARLGIYCPVHPPPETEIPSPPQHGETKRHRISGKDAAAGEREEP